MLAFIIMEAIGSRVFVKFDESHNKVFNVGGIELIKPDVWTYKAGESDDKMEGKVNKLLINPQIAEVVATNPKHKIAKGDKVFVHYMAYEWKDENAINLNGIDCTAIDANQVIFKIIDNEIELVDDVFLGELIYEDKMTTSGLIINVDNVRKAATIKITNKPKNVKRGYEMIKEGMTVTTIDDHQYIINFNKKDYVVVKSHEIVGIID